MIRTIVAVAALLAASGATARPLTLRHAAALPDEALARRVLGEAGRLYP